jgi:hypothetical protein
MPLVTSHLNKVISIRFKLFLSVTVLSAILFSCDSSDKKNLSDSSKTSNDRRGSIKHNNYSGQDKIDSALSFEKKIYFKIVSIYCGPTYTNRSKETVFYRVLEIAEEENITLFAENISVGEEGGNYGLIDRIRLTDDKSSLPRFGLNKVDSLKFIDSVTIVGYFNKQKMKINLSLKKR